MNNLKESLARELNDDRYDLKVVAKAINQLRESFINERSMETLNVLIDLYQEIGCEASLIVSDLANWRTRIKEAK